MSSELFDIFVVYPIVAVILCAVVWFGSRALRSSRALLDESDDDLWRNW